MKQWLLILAAICAAAGLAYWFFHSPTAPPAAGLEPAPAQVPSVSAPVNAGTTSAATSLQPMAIAPGATTRSETVSNTSPTVPTVAGKSATGAPPAPASIPSPTEASGIPPAILLENMRTTLRQYGLMFGGNPVGTNPEITKALNGNNPKQVNFLGTDGNRVNERGELCDAWGTPYFFHQLSAMEMEIRSAGPDRILYTDDDLVIK